MGVPIFFKIDFSYELNGSAKGALFDFIGLKIYIGMKFLICGMFIFSLPKKSVNLHIKERKT